MSAPSFPRLHVLEAQLYVSVAEKVDGQRLTSHTHNLPFAPSPPLPTLAKTSPLLRPVVLCTVVFSGPAPFAPSNLRFLPELVGVDVLSGFSSTGMGYGE